MKIKLAILEKDRIYLERIVSAFNVKFADKLEVYSFTDMDVAIETIIANKLDVLLVDESFEIDKLTIPPRCAMAYLVSSSDIDSLRNEIAISKYQKADLIYKQVLNLYSENSADITGIHFEESENTKIITFLSPAGGTGCTTAAAACAVHFAKSGKRVLFLELETFDTTDLFFKGDGNGDLSDVIYAIKSKKGNLTLKLESTVRQDNSGVYFYEPAKTILDMRELNCEEIRRLISQLKLFGNYDYVILTIDFNLDPDTLSILKDSSKIVLMSDGSHAANKKIEKAVEAVNILEQQLDYKLIIKTGILYNRVSSHSSEKVNIPDMKEYGGINRYEGYPVEQLLKELSSLSVFDTIA